MNRVVISGLGLLAPNAHGLEAFDRALRNGVSGIRHWPRLRELGFRCQLAGIPPGVEKLKKKYFTDEALFSMNSGMIHGCIAGVDCWRDAGFEVPPELGGAVDWDTGAIIGTMVGGLETIGAKKLIQVLEAGQVKRLGSVMIEQLMLSAVAARLGGFLALGGQCTAHSNGRGTGQETVIQAFEAVQDGRGLRFLAGAAEGADENSMQYCWGLNEVQGKLVQDYNDRPAFAACVLSAHPKGIVPAAGSGILMLEEKESARAREARVHAEILGAATSAGPDAAVRAIREALASARVRPEEVDLISGDLPGGLDDRVELQAWAQAIGRDPAESFPWISATQSLIGTAFGASPSIELIATILQLQGGYVHGSVHCDSIAPELDVFARWIPRKTIAAEVKVAGKLVPGLDGTYSCVFLKRPR